MHESDQPYVLYMGTFPPRECGIATFTEDLTEAIDQKFSPSIKSAILAMNRNGTNIYNYPRKVRYQLTDNDIDEYIRLAKKINDNDKIKLVNIQHEFGIFGGEYGNYLVPFLELLHKPTIVTLHSILPKPNDQLKRVVQAIGSKVDAFVVMNRFGKDLLREDYGVKTAIEVIPHGIPYTPFVPSSVEKKRLGFEDKLVISSFGMLNKGKGYEYVIESLPKVVKKFPNLLYLIVGETHPVVRKKEGEEYRNFLESRVKALGLHNHVKFYNKYVTLKEIVMYLRASDIYISSGLDPNQITSGTLAYALGCGRPVISTPFLHAREIVTPKRGILVEFKVPEDFTKALIHLLGRPDIRADMASHAYHETRNMTWDNVAMKYGELFQQHAFFHEANKKQLPKIRMQHLIRLTDNFGVIQFAKNTVPDKNSGYTLDDVSRALITATKYYASSRDKTKLTMIETYLNFIQYVQDADGKFYNVVNRNKEIDKESWAEDAHGRALWALGYLINQPFIPSAIREQAKSVFDKSLGINQCVESPRALCFTIIGYYFYNAVYPSDTNKSLVDSLAQKLVDLYEDSSKGDWKWFESYLTYDNSKLAEGLLYAHLATGNETYLKVGLAALDFLVSVCFENDLFLPIGQQGWYSRGGQRAYFDQQPIEASSMVQTLAVAHSITGKKDYLGFAVKAFGWFLGNNISKQVLYNETTGGCYDGLGKASININQGAESTLSYLLARLTLEEALAGKS